VAEWNSDRSKLVVRGTGDKGNTVTVVNANDTSQVLGTRSLKRNRWAIRKTNPNPVPCAVLVMQSNDEVAGPLAVQNRPADCGPGSPPAAPPVASANGPYVGTTGASVSFSSAGSNDPDGNIASYAWVFGDGGTSNAANPGHTYSMAGTFDVTLTVMDNDGATDSDTTTATITDEPPVVIPDVSINSTSQNGIPGMPVSEQSLTGLSDYKLFSANDLGMHCGDFDTRISSILPPFQVVHTQVIRRGSEPDILTPADGVEVVYSASSNPGDPILTGINSAGDGPVLSSMLADGSVYKTNFWDVARDAYDPFYPEGILPAFYPPGNILDLGLPMPNAEQLFLGDGNLTAEQQEMPGRFGPYLINDPKTFNLFTVDQPFFIGLPFGYTSEDVNWFEAAGIPLTAFDDFGRENPWALMRVQARSGGQVLASLDTVLPISGEANCGFCHNGQMDGGNGAATANLSKVALSIDDTANVPMEVSLEWAADINLLRLHDQKHSTHLIVGTSQDDPPGPMPFKPVVCQTCHYTPALDLAQLGPLGPENDGPLILNGVEVSPSLANGRDQLKQKSMSNVMHGHHGTLDVNSLSPGDPGYNGNDLMFPTMLPPVDGGGNLRDPVAARDVLMDTCYQCHPGRRTDCLRGAMASGGMLCQDCHGDMQQVGDDFTRTVSTPDHIGDFDFVGNFYTDPEQPRVPWANEPGCGSCHTGDAMDNMHGDPNTLGDPVDGIRLMQAFLIDDDKATPIVPTNKRFAENTTAASDPAGAGNPMLYRVSKGHEGVFCEACHGSTHGIWPNGNPNANDNVAAMQLQGHTGTITECSTCHGNEDLGLTQDGPHGMHPVSQISNGAVIDTDVTITRWNSGHEEFNDFSSCRACHGVNGEGTVLSRTAADRTLECKEDDAPGCTKVNINGEEERRVFVARGTEISCVLCHDNKINEGGGD
jgi:PKD repeat protein